MSRSDNRIRLSQEELELIEYWRTTGTLPDAYVIRSDLNLIKLKEKCSELERRYKKLLTDHERTQTQMNIVMELNESPPPNFKVTAGKKGSKVGEATAVIVASDWHVEEKVDPNTINGKNTYNLKEARKRAEKFFSKGMWLTDLIRKGINIDTLVFAILGDIITGYIHEEFLEDNYLSPTEAVLFANDLICGGLDFLLKKGKFRQIVIPCCFGNHGRTTPKKRVSTSYKNSYEWLLYQMLSKQYKNEKRVKFIIGNGYHNYLTLYNKYQLRFHHGDAIRYAGGVGGITIPTNKAIRGWNTNENSYLDVFGHFHQQFDGGSFISNGSLIGWNAYANSIKATYESPKQSFFVIDKERGKIVVAPIFVTNEG